MDNNILQSQCQFNSAFDNSESKELDKLARKINNKHAKSNNTFSKKFSGIVCDQLDCTPYSQQMIGGDNVQSFFSAQGDYSPLYAPVNAPLLSIKNNPRDDSSIDSSNDSSFKSTLGGKVFSESDSFQSLSSSPLDENSLSSTYSSLPSKIKKRLRMSSPHLKKNKTQSTNSDDNDILHLKSCNDCRSKLMALLSNSNIFTHNNLSTNQNQTNENNKPIQKSSNSFLNLTNPELKDIMVLILIGVIIILLIDIFVRQ
jgi:hypothetical protein